MQLNSTGRYALLVLSLAWSLPGPVGKLQIQSAFAQTPQQYLTIADQLERQGIQQLQSNHVEAALQSWQQALNIYRQTGARQHEVRLLGNFGQLFLQLQDYSAAISYLQQGLAIAQEMGDPAARQHLLLKMGRAFRHLQEDDNAAVYYQQALAIAQQLNDPEGIGMAAGSLGQIYQTQGNDARAVEYYRQAWQAARQINDAKLAISALGSLGDIYYDRKEYGAAIPIYTQLWHITREIDDRSLELVAVKTLGNAYYYLGNCEYAAAFYDWGWSIARDIADEREACGMLQNRGNAEYCLGKFETALNSYTQCLTIARQLGDREIAGQLMGNIGLVYIHLGEYQKAIDHLEEDLAVARQFQNLQIEGQALGSLGDAYYFRGDYHTAHRYYRESYQLSKKTGYTRGSGLMLTNIGAALHQLQQPVEAESALREGIAVLTSLREKSGDTDEHQISLFEREARAYRILQHVLISQNKIEEALEVAEAGRARAFVRLLAGKRALSGKIHPPSIEKIKNIAARRNVTLVEYSLIYDKEENKEREAQLYIWVVRPDGRVGFRPVDLSAKNVALADLVKKTRTTMGVRERGATVIGSPSAGEFRQNLRVWYDLLIAPVAEFLPDQPEAPMVLVPHEELFMVPFGAIQNSAGKFLIENHTLLISPGLHVLEFLPGKTSAPAGALVVGNPEMPSLRSGPDQPPVQLSSLPGAEREATMVAGFLNTRAITGTQATKANIVGRMEDASIIHLATHGLLDVSASGWVHTNIAGYRGDGGAIALAPSGDDNGLLTVEEILQVELNADLIVLSACNTGRGRITGDGVLGLSRSFLAAGAARVLVSLWSVPDAPTADLMAAFYRHLQRDSDPARALRQAMLQMIQSHPNPKDWAAFALIGNPDSP